jgi:hypothetical protein
VALLFVHPRSQSQHRNTNPASGWWNEWVYKCSYGNSWFRWCIC